MNNVIPITQIKRFKPTDKLELILLPPIEPEEVGEEDVKNFYKNLAKILLSDD